MNLNTIYQLFIFAGFFLFSVPFIAQETDQKQIGDYRKNFLSDNKKITKLDSLADNILVKFIRNSENCGISVGISKNGDNYFYNYGEVKRNSAILPDQNTIYEIGSLTAAFCGVLLGHAINEKKINPEDDIRNYLPGNFPHLSFGKTAIKVKYLANHSSGLTNIPDDLKSGPGFDSLNPYWNYTSEMLYHYLKTVRLNAEPGKVCSYSNLGMAVLGLVLEKAFGQTFESLVKEKICSQNLMASTGINLSADQLKFFAEGHNNQGESTPHWEFGAFKSAGALKSSTRDMLQFLNYNLSEKDEATKFAQHAPYNGCEKFGSGWFIKKTNPGNTLVWQNGATYGFAGFAGFVKEKNCSIVILTNSLTSVDYIAIAVLKYLER